MFRARNDIPVAGEKPAPPIPAVIPIVRAPDDPGVDEGTGSDEFAEIPARGRQEGGWRGFLSRMRD
jgi:HemY protein